MVHYLIECRDYDHRILLAEPGKDIQNLEGEFKRAVRPRRKCFSNFIDWLVDFHGFVEPETIDHSCSLEAS